MLQILSSILTCRSFPCHFWRSWSRYAIVLFRFFISGLLVDWLQRGWWGCLRLGAQVEVVDYICDVCYSIFGRCFFNLVGWISCKSSLSFCDFCLILILEFDLICRHLQITHLAIVVNNYLYLLIWISVDFIRVNSHHVANIFGPFLWIFLAFSNPWVDERLLFTKVCAFVWSSHLGIYLKLARGSCFNVAENCTLDLAGCLGVGTNSLVF